MYLKKFILLFITFVGLRLLTLYFMNGAIQLTYLTANSLSMYKKTKLAAKQSNRMRWFTRLCFWNAKSREKGALRILIVWRLVAIVTLIPLVILFVFFACSDDTTVTERMVLWLSRALDVITGFLTCMWLRYCRWLNSKKQRKG